MNTRVVFTMGGKGGVGKTGLMVTLAEWFEANEIPFTLLDLDTENRHGDRSNTSSTGQ
jgi:MinD superfamily P-loop ATPase